MAQYLTLSQAREFEIDGKTYDLIDLIETVECVPDGWVSPISVNELTVGQTAYVQALGGFRRGVVARLGRTKATVALTTQGAMEWAKRHGSLSDASIRVADTAIKLSQIYIPASTVPVFPPVPVFIEPTVPRKITPSSVQPVQTGDMTGSAVVTLLEEVWDRIRQNHPELPTVIIVTGTGMIGPSRWGHFRADGWMARVEGESAATNLALGEMFMAGETLAKGARQVLQTMLHEAAHVLARVRELKDTSRQGRWHNNTFKTLAEELGLEHKRTSANAQHGFSFVTLTEVTEAKYADLLDELDKEVRLVVDLPWFLKGTEQSEGNGDEGGEYIHGGRQRRVAETPQSGNLKATCGCTGPNIIRASRKVLDLGVIRCDECEELFTA